MVIPDKYASLDNLYLRMCYTLYLQNFWSGSYGTEHQFLPMIDIIW